MFDHLSEESFLQLATKHSRVVVYKEIMGDQITPVQVYHALIAQMKGATLLESSPKESSAGRFSFLGFTPQAQLTIKNKHIHIQDTQGSHTLTGDALDAVRVFYQARRAILTHVSLGFAGGIVGFVAYDAARLFEEKLQNNHQETDFPDIVFKSYQDQILFDHKTGQVILATVVDIGKISLPELYQQAMKRLETFHETISTAPSVDTRSQKTTENSGETLSLDDAAYIAAGKKAQQYIQAGDAFQIVLARTFNQSFTGDPFDIYRVLRYRNPSPYMFYLDHDEYVICGASPEKMISVQEGLVQSCPLAGTRPRGGEYNDAQQSEDLLSDTKEVSEHMMLVDLARNDIGRVAKPGSVRMTKLKQIQQFSHVMHISSTVEAPLAKGLDALDALRASFPAGTLSGAPKIRAMGIIDELEGQRRRLYGGAICFLDAQGNFDSCIAIRMALIKQGMAYVSAGAGIVADSDLQKEADETRQKARVVLEAIQTAQRGIQ